MDRDLLVKNIVSTVKLARVFRLPIVHSTVNVKSGRGKPTVSPLGELLKDDPTVDRTSTNAWEDAAFVRAVRATGRRKLIFCALWTEICMAFPALDALREGYEVYPVVDAIGGTSLEAHRAGLERVVQGAAAQGMNERTPLALPGIGFPDCGSAGAARRGTGRGSPQPLRRPLRLRQRCLSREGQFVHGGVELAGALAFERRLGPRLREADRTRAGARRRRPRGADNALGSGNLAGHYHSQERRHRGAATE